MKAIKNCKRCGVEFTYNKFPCRIKEGADREFCSLACATGWRARKHGYAVERGATYRIWQSMRSRILSPGNAGYKDYGGRGITICDRWLESFENFLTDMGERPEGKSIDRIDNDKGYSPENCRWATPAEQMNNTRWNRMVTYDGRTQCVSAWARELDMTSTGLSYRLKTWGVEHAIDPVKRKHITSRLKTEHERLER